MRLSEDFVTYDASEKEILLVSIGNEESFKGLAKTNETAAIVVEMLKEDVTEEAIIDRINSEYNAPREVIAADVRELLAKLREIGAVVE